MIITPKQVEGYPLSTLVQPASFGRYRAFDLRDAAMGYTYETERLIAQRVSKKEVLEQAHALLDNPFMPGIHFVCSTTDSERPNLFASWVARRALGLYDEGYPKRRRSQYGKPEFMYMYGSFNQIDKMMSRVSSNWPITLVIAGLDLDSSNNKWDAARDVINMATRCDTSVIVVASGLTPHAVQYDKLRVAPTTRVLVGYPDLEKGGVV